MENQINWSFRSHQIKILKYVTSNQNTKICHIKAKYQSTKMSYFSFPFQFLAVFEFWRNVECRHWQLGNTVKHKQKIVKCKTLSNMELCEIWVHHHNMVNTVVKFEQKTTSLDFLIYQTMNNEIWFGWLRKPVPLSLFWTAVEQLKLEFCDIQH